jgi:DNA gyrase subunit A
MGRDTSGVRGMNVSRGDNWVLAMDVITEDTDVLVVTDNGYGKRTAVSDYPRKGRGAMGVKTIQMTEKKGGLVAALIVREHQDLVFISREGMVQRTSVRGISRYGRASQGVRVMNLRDDDVVSAVALVVDDSPDTAAAVAELEGPVDAGETTAQPPELTAASEDGAGGGDAAVDNGDPSVDGASANGDEEETEE